MGFGAEMRDFVSAFNATASVGGKIADRRAKRELTRGPTEEELGAIPDPLSGSGGAVPQATSHSDEGGTGSISGTGEDETLVGSTGGDRMGRSFPQKAYDYYRGKGLSHSHSAGIAANLMQESGGDPNVFSGKRRGDNGASAFAGQWQGPRLRNLISFAGSKTPTLDQQFDFVLEESNPNSPYADKGAVKAFQLASEAKSPAEAVAAYRQFYERPSADDLNKRLSYLADISDGGSYQQVASGAIPEPDTGTEPSTSGDELANAFEGTGGEGGGTEDVRHSDESGIDIPAVDFAMGPVPQVVAFDQQLVGGGQPPRTAEEAEPVLAAETGGTMPSGVDPYNPARAFTQQPGTDSGGAVPTLKVPRRINFAAAGAAPGVKLAGGLTPSQVAWKKLLAAKPVTPAKTTPAAPQQPGPQPFIAKVHNTPQRGFGNTRTTAMLPQGAEWTDARSGKMRYNNQDYQLDARSSMWVPVGAGQMQPIYHGGWTSYQWQPNQPAKPGAAFEKGGMVPSEVNYARGGRVGRSQHDPGYTTSASYDRNQEYWKPGSSMIRRKREDAEAPARKDGGGKRQKRRSKAADVPIPQRRPEAADVPVPQRRPDATTVASPPERPIGSMPAAAIPMDNVMPTYPEPPVAGNQPPGGIPAPPGWMEKERASAAPPPPAKAAPAIPVYPEPPVPNNQPYGGIPSPPGWMEKELNSAPAVAPQSLQPSNKYDFTVIPPSPPHLLPIIGSDGTVIGYTPGDGPTYPQPPVPNNQPPGGIPAPPGWMEKERASEGGYKTIEEQLFGEPVYAEGGMVGESWHDPNYTTSKSYGNAPDEDPESSAYDDVKPTKKLLDHVAIALNGGKEYLQEHFGLSGGAIATPESGQVRQQAARRFAMGEGEATPEELRAVDSQIDPEGRLSEGDRQMTRLAKMTQWYLGRGSKKAAAASAASLMQAGASRFSRLGTMAEAAYGDFLQSGKEEDLQATLRYLEKAYDLIPDGARVNVSIDKENQRLLATRELPDGGTEQFVVQPDDLPDLIAQVRDKSAYWQQVFSLADPVGYRQQAGWAHQEKMAARRDATTERRALAREDRAENRALSREERAEQRALAREKRAAAEADRRAARNDVDWETVNPLRAAADAAVAADVGDDPALTEKKNQAISRLQDALPENVDRAKIMRDLGYEPGTWQYVAPAAPAAGAASIGAGGVNAPKARTATGPNGEKVILKDGKWVPMT